MSAKIIIDLCNAILEEKNAEARKDLSYKLSKRIGYWDKAKRFYLFDEYQTKSSLGIRTPSRAWNLSVYKHVCSKKYVKQLVASPVLFAEKLDEEMKNGVEATKEVRKI